tara:strand:+ start:136 stop:588 length:453 start_codon:yes stop_codon:yes gene_type:complete
MITKKKRFNVHIILPILVGGIIYVCFRTKNLVLFDWLEFIGLDPIVDMIRLKSKQCSVYLPDQFIYSLPAGLWLYSFISFNILIRKNINDKMSLFWLLFPLIISLLSEFLQYIGLLKGTYSRTDILYYLFFGILACNNIISRKNGTTKTQ